MGCDSPFEGSDAGDHVRELGGQVGDLLVLLGHLDGLALRRGQQRDGQPVVGDAVQDVGSFGFGSM